MVLHFIYRVCILYALYNFGLICKGKQETPHQKTLNRDRKTVRKIIQGHQKYEMFIFASDKSRQTCIERK